MKQTIIELKEAAKHYEMGENLVKALDCINISIEEGDFVAIMGPSGSGKSTAMNLIGSLDLTTHGDIYLKGENIEDLGESELAQLRGKRIGFILDRSGMPEKILAPLEKSIKNTSLITLYGSKSRKGMIDNKWKVIIDAS